MKIAIRLAIIFKFAFLLICVPKQLCAQQSQVASQQQEMTFQVFQYSDDFSPARFAMIADGLITPRTPHRFKAAARSLPPGSIIYLNSDGGSLLPALALGMNIHEHRLTTFVLSGAKCTSACAYAFLGGKTRKVFPGAFIGLHRFYSRDFPSSTQEFQNEQKVARDIVEILNGYIVSVNGDPGLVALAQLVNPNEMLYLDSLDLLRLGVATEP